MSEAFESVYPDLLRTGLEKLATLESRRDLLALFSALEHFRRDLHDQGTAEAVLQVSQGYVSGLNLFRASGFWLVNPVDFSFDRAECSPDKAQTELNPIVAREIQSGRFGWALRQGSPVFFQAKLEPALERGVLHSLAVSSRVLGMFVGILHGELAPSQEIHFSLLSMLLGACADALATLHKTSQLTDQIKTLSGLLPVCAWCRKVRDDQGYWEQIESYVTAHSEASFTHSICPDCQCKFMATPWFVRR